MKVTASELGEETFKSVCGFIREATQFIPDVQVVIPNKPLLFDVEKLEKIATDDLGVKVVRHDFAVYA